VVVPAIGIVPRNNYRSLFPLTRLLQSIEDVNDEQLFIQWRRVIRVAILCAPCFQETYGRHIAGIHSGPEIAYIVIVVGLVSETDHRDGTRRRVMWVRSRLLVRECRSDAGGRGWFETTLEPAAGNSFVVEQVADVHSAKPYSPGSAAVVILRIGITDHGLSTWALIMSPLGPSASVPPVAITGKVFPEMRLRAPGVEGPNVVPNELSLSAKCCA